MVNSTEHKTNNTTTTLVHVIFWLLFTHLVFDIAGLYDSFQELYREREFIDEAFILLPIMMGLFYWNSHFLIPKYLNQKSWKKYLFTLTLSFLFFIFLGYGIDYFLENQGFEFNLDREEVVDFLAQFNVLVIGISTSLGLSKIAMENTTQKKEAQAKQQAAELKYLTAQVNPHFLHNTLNTIYSLANDETAPKTQDAILKLSKMMRYMVKESSQSEVVLQKEIDFLQEFVELQKMRLAGAVPVDFIIKGKVEQQNIAPLLLITVIENTFKHGVQYHPPQPILIELSIESIRLHLLTKNIFNPKKSTSEIGTGLNNLRKRLTYLYPDKHQLTITKKDGLFEVLLVINF